MHMSDREIKVAAIVVGVAYVAVWIASLNELRYWWWGRTVEAEIVDREEHEVEHDDWEDHTHSIDRYVRLTYSFHDEVLGKDRTEASQELKKGPLREYKDPQIEIQYLPGSAGTSRVPSALGRYFAVIFLLVHGLLAALALWGWWMMKSDTWATKPGRRK